MRLQNTIMGKSAEQRLTRQSTWLQKPDSMLVSKQVFTHGGMGYAKEYHVERLMREVMIPRIAPVSRELIFNYIAEKVLGLPRSF